MTLRIQRRPLEGDVFDPSLHPVLDRVYRGRHVTLASDLDTKANGLCHFNLLKGASEAASILISGLKQGKRLIIVGDFDADGATSTALSILALRMMGMANIDYLVPNRFDFGYGLSSAIVDVAHEKGADIIMTVDNGIACFEGVNRAKELGIQVIITDHHLPAESLPIADAIVNPNQPDCTFPSKNMAGVGVAFYLMLACRSQLVAESWFESQGVATPNLASLLDIVAVGTVADVVKLDKNNRIMVHQGLQRIKSGQCQPGIKALVEVAQKDATRLTATDLGFVIGPRLNAAGRLEDMALGIECLLCDDPMQARFMAVQLDELNQQRKAIEKEMKTQAEQVINTLSFETSSLPAGLVLYQRDFHQGVIGIVAGRIKEQHMKPTIAFAREDSESLKGSARSIEGIHIRDVLEEVNCQNPDLIKKFGGHAMAAGLSIDEGKLESFTTAFVSVVERHMERLGDNQVIFTDGELATTEIGLPLAKLIKNAGPFGQGFEPPAFDGVFRIVNQRIVGQNHLKLVLLTDEGEEVDAIAFNVELEQWPCDSTKYVQIVYQLDVNVFRGRETAQFIVSHIEKNG